LVSLQTKEEARARSAIKNATISQVHGHNEMDAVKFDECFVNTDTPRSTIEYTPQFKLSEINDPFDADSNIAETDLQISDVKPTTFHILFDELLDAFKPLPIGICIET